MSAEAFSSIPPQLPVALIDLVETKTPEANHAFVTRVTQLTEEVGGRRVLANEVIIPMIVSDERASKSDHATRLLVVTWYPTKQAGQIALAKRKERGPELFTESIRTYALRPVGRIESLFGRTLPFSLGLLGRKPVPKIDDAQKLQSLIDDALILGEQPDEARWTELAERAGDRPIWMLNFLEFAKTAVCRGYGLGRDLRRGHRSGARHRTLRDRRAALTRSGVAPGLMTRRSQVRILSPLPASSPRSRSRFRGLSRRWRWARCAGQPWR